MNRATFHSLTLCPILHKIIITKPNAKPPLLLSWSRKRICMGKGERARAGRRIKSKKNICALFLQSPLRSWFFSPAQVLCVVLVSYFWHSLGSEDLDIKWSNPNINRSLKYFSNCIFAGEGTLTVDLEFLYFEMQGFEFFSTFFYLHTLIWTIQLLLAIRHSVSLSWVQDWFDILPCQKPQVISVLTSDMHCTSSHTWGLVTIYTPSAAWVSLTLQSVTCAGCGRADVPSDSVLW